MGRRKRDNLESKVSKVPGATIHSDSNHRAYIPLCNYSWHVGIILKEDVCIKRDCHHYIRAYLDTHRKPSKYKQDER